MKEFKNEISWSVSRDDTFRKCRRMYYFQYYGFWGGWDFAADKRTRMIYILKQLQNRQMWAGKIVHKCIEKTLKNIKDGIKVNEERVIEETLDVMRDEFKSSQAKIYLTNPKTCALYEHEYELTISDNEWKGNANHVIECLKIFFDSHVYEKILKLSANQWLEIEQFSSFSYRNIKVFAVFDFAYRDGDEIIIYDWKTGKEEHDKHELQLACYGLFATKKWGVKPELVKLVELYLSHGKHIANRLCELDINSIQDQIWNSIEAMQNILDNPIENIAHEDNFPFTENERICQYCNFKKICPRFI